MAFYAAGWRRRGAPAADRPRRPARPRARRPARRARRRCPRRRRSGASAPRAGGPCAGPARAPRAPHAPACARGSTACPPYHPTLSLTCSSLRARLQPPPSAQLCAHQLFCTRCASHASAHACGSTAHPQHGFCVQQSVCKLRACVCALLVQPCGTLAQHGARGGQPRQALAAGRAGLPRASSTSYD